MKQAVTILFTIRLTTNKFTDAYHSILQHTT